MNALVRSGTQTYIATFRHELVRYVSTALIALAIAISLTLLVAAVRLFGALLPHAQLDPHRTATMTLFAATTGVLFLAVSIGSWRSPSFARLRVPAVVATTFALLFAIVPVALERQAPAAPGQIAMEAPVSQASLAALTSRLGQLEAARMAIQRDLASVRSAERFALEKRDAALKSELSGTALNRDLMQVAIRSELTSSAGAPADALVAFSDGTPPFLLPVSPGGSVSQPLLFAWKGAHGGLPKRGTLLFDGESDHLTADSAKSATLLANRIAHDRPMPDRQVLIEAYAGAPQDSSASARLLSLKRALAVRRVLVGHGVAASRIALRAMGGVEDNGPADRVDVFAQATTLACMQSFPVPGDPRHGVRCFKLTPTSPHIHFFVLPGGGGEN
jgi:outer membrane protein OmpA-like peptidoglycan-associated protein